MTHKHDKQPEMKQPLKRIFISNTFFMLLMTFVWPLSIFYITILIAKYLGPEKLGEFSIISNYCTIFRDIAIIGLPALLAREIATLKEKGNAYLVNALTIAFFSSITAIAVLNLLCYFLGYPERMRTLILVFSFGIFFDVLAKYAETAYLARDKISIFSTLIFICLLLQLFFTTLLLFKGYGLYMIVIVFVITKASILSAGILLLHRKVFFLSLRSIHIRILKNILSLVPVFSFLAILEMLLFRIDIAILSKLFEEAVVGLYSIAKKIIFFVYFLSVSIVFSAFPLLAQEYKRERKAFYDLTGKILIFIFMASLGINVNLWILSEIIVTTLFGRAYLDAVTILKIMSFSALPIFLSTYLSKILVVIDKQKSDLFMLSTGFVFLIYSFLSLYSFFGITGCSFSFVASFLFLTTLRMILIGRYEKMILIKIIELSLKFLFPAAGMTLILYFVHDFSLSAKLLLTNLIYLFILFLSDLINFKDIVMLKTIIFGKKK
ncbi:MAG: oligosaccharide flippase family protein [Candidatus Aureabacteria bacterium]|nr:oligosaccharide flippase family protein [Candidatus Auribacterota bacterium]